MPDLITIQNGVYPVLERMYREWPQEFPKALNNFGQRLRKRMMQEIRAGRPAGTQLPPLNPDTLKARANGPQTKAAKRAQRALRQQRKGDPAYKVSQIAGYGGKLSDLIRYATAANGSSMDYALEVGWLDSQTPGVSKSAEKWQDAVQRQMTNKERRFRRVYGLTQPRTYSKPERAAIRCYQLSQPTHDDMLVSMLKSIQANLENNARSMTPGGWSGISTP